MPLLQRLKMSRFFAGEGPETGTITLNQRRIYILPTRAGISFIVILFAMFLASINYNNSLAFMLTFLLTSVSIVSILHCFRNLQGLQLHSTPPQPVFAGEPLQLPIYLFNPSPRQRLGIKLGWPKQAPLHVDLAPQQGEWLQLAMPTQQRGWHTIGKITLYTRFPLGLFHAWSHVQFDISGLAYPKPGGEPRLPLDQALYMGAEGSHGRGSDDFIGQRPYHPGDSLRHLNWRALAREQGLLTKQFGGDRTDELTLSWQMVAALPLEMKLSQLARWILQAEQNNLRYGLELPGSRLAPGHGESHRQACLKILALYGQQA